MEMSYLRRAGPTPTALALAVTVWFSAPVAAQPSDKDQHAESTDVGNRNDAALARDKSSDLLIETQNASGTFGVALPLEIRLVRVRNVYIEAIKLLGLPRGVTISDSSNTYSSSSDNNDVDVSAWDLSKIQITQNDQNEASFSLAVAAIWIPESGGHIDVTSSRLSVNFVPEHRSHIAAASVDETARPEERAAPIRAEIPASRVVSSQAVHSQAVPSQAVPSQAVPSQAFPSRALANREAPVVERAAPAPPSAAPGSTGAIVRPAPSRAAGPRPDSAGEVAYLPPSAAPVQPPTGPDPLVERAKGLIRLGDISGARLLLERAQARHAPDATFLLAQTWDPAMLRSWKVRGLRADPDLARSLYAKAASQPQTDERRPAVTGR